jgi:transposase/uncharacterized protein YdcH (DUF465 family)
MAKYKGYNYSQLVMLPVSLEHQLMPGTLEFAIHTLVENHMNMSRFDERYNNDETGRSAYDPKVLLKVVLLGYSRGLTSSRKIEQACKDNVIFIALTCGQYPDHSTIAAFVTSMKDEILPLFRDVLLVCDQMDLLGGTFFALDGLRLPSNASKKWSGTLEELQGRKERMEAKVERLLEEHAEQDKDGEDAVSSDREKRQRQIDRLKKQAARIEEWLSENEGKVGAQGREITSNVTDNESAKMHTSHGTIQGYNGQGWVDSKRQVIVNAEAFGDSQDFEHISPMLEGAKETMQAIGHDEDYLEGTILTADANYHSASNIGKCVEEKVDAYIPDRYYRRRDPSYEAQRRYWPKKKNRFSLEDFQYKEETDEYVCPCGRSLKLNTAKYKNYGNLYRRYAGDPRECSKCRLKGRCLRGKSRRRWLCVPYGTEGPNYSKLMVAKVHSERGQKIYPQRLAIVEPVFANIREWKRLSRFTLRGKVKVNIQWLLYCMVHNMEKIANYGLTWPKAQRVV